MNTLVTYRKVARIVGESASLRGCIQEIFYFLPKVEIICVLFCRLFFSVTPVKWIGDRRKVLSLAVNQMLWRRALPHRTAYRAKDAIGSAWKRGENPYSLVRSFKSCAP